MGDYCKYCGSSDLEKVKYEAKYTNSTKTSKHIGLSHIIKAGVDNSSEGKIENTLYIDTYHCKKCKKIDCLCNIEPLEISISGDYEYKIIIPDAFQELLKNFHVDEIKLKNLISNLVNQRGIKKNINDFITNGNNKYKNNMIGFHHKLKIDNRDISINILMEMKDGMLLRIIYDGGKSI
ncbi:TVG0738178 [Thermoplasma volcanium GSS1]|uniref:TVG0738178 protein n=1 Tax=Thermoplasma volcanium (strain ATCC 51530 / DSM 4299 / JCM 9571 / NBRC 15438 / GSS1) TaxID=273116 RepID=Q97AS7_THEVO|nr:hypothetical protein [Thermoplasma volcanium]BAB59874.1 TVG0738178 [Thermoplasma volcanium GSS1]